MKGLSLTTLLLVVIIIIVGKGVADTVRCPRYCSCYLNITDNMRSVSCVARRLDNIDLLIPKRVQSLDLSNNSISVLEDRGLQALGLIEIINLVMKHNSIRTIGLHSFAGLPYLEWVDLTDNNLYQILPWTFHDNTNLKFVSLSHNPLGHIISSGPFLDVSSLETLELSNCNFVHFSQDAFAAMPNLRRLDISHNQLISFDIYSMQFLYNLEQLDISKNPWPCNINLKNLKEFLDIKSSKLIGSSCDLQDVQVKPAKFEKMISVGVAYPVYDDFSTSNDDDDISTSDDDDNNSAEENLKQNVVACDYKVKREPDLFCQSKHVVLPTTWLILIGFQLGVCATLFLGYAWIYCTNHKKKYQPLEPTISVTPVVTEFQAPLICPEVQAQPMQTSLGIASCPETPPPTYRELFISSES